MNIFVSENGSIFSDSVKENFSLVTDSNGALLLTGFDYTKACTVFWSSDDFIESNGKEIPYYLKTRSHIPEIKEFIDKVESEKLKRSLNKKRPQLNLILEGWVKECIEEVGVDYGIKYPDSNDRSLLILTVYSNPKETWYVYRGAKGLQKFVLNNSEKILNKINPAPYLPTNEILVESLKKFSRKTKSLKAKLFRDLILQGNWPAFVDNELTQMFDYVTTIKGTKYYFVSSKQCL